MKRVVKTMGILMLTFFLAAPCFARRVHLDKGNPKKSLPINLPVEADIDDDTRVLTILFLEDIGDVFVEVKNSAGDVIYYEPAEGNDNVFVSLANQDAGVYQVFIIVKDNFGYYGNFELF